MMDVKSIMESNISWEKNRKYHMISLICDWKGKNKEKNTK